MKDQQSGKKWTDFLHSW